MGWRLKHKLFGWHFVAVYFGGSDHIVRVEVLPTGRMVVVFFETFYDLDCEKMMLRPATDGRERPFLPLTWVPQAAAGSAA